MNLRVWLRQREGTRGVRGEWPRNLDGIRAAAEIIWRRPLHRYYTDHSVDHSERIIEKLSKLTEDLISGNNISSTEVYVLLAAAYLHDIGMQDERAIGRDLDQIRYHHHELTRKIITDRYIRQTEGSIRLGFNDLVPLDIVHTIASIAEAHRRTNLQESQYNEFTYGDHEIRPRFLAALLRLADELDIDHRRVDIQVLSLMDNSDKAQFYKSEAYWYLCDYVSGVQIHNGLITVHYQYQRGAKDTKKSLSRS